MPARINRLAVTTLLAAFVASAAPLPAQRLSDPLPSSVRLSGSPSYEQTPGRRNAPQARPRFTQSRADSTRVDPQVLVAGGILGGLGGMLAGALIAVPVASMSFRGGSGYEGLLAAAAGLTIGEVLGVSYGVHRAGGRRGSFLINAAASAGVATAAIILAGKASRSCNGCGELFAVAVPVVQIGAVIAVDRAWARR